MGLWSQEPSQSTDNYSATGTPAVVDKLSPTVPSQTAEHTAIEPKLKALSRDELAYEELKELFSQINPEASARAAVAAKNPPKAPVSQEEYNSSIYPSTMSCHQVFDQAYYCSSLGGQANNIYRFGALRSCTDLWRQWRFCMRTKAMGKEERKQRIWQWEKERAAKYKMGKSSEDIWEVRKEPLEHAYGGFKDEDNPKVDG